MRASFVLVVLAAVVGCRTEDVPENTSTKASASASPPPVIESPQPTAPPDDPTATATETAPAIATTDAAPRPFANLPHVASDIPAAWLACASNAECVAVPSLCCGAWPSNAASRGRIVRAVAAADAARGNCRDRVCALRHEEAECQHGKCVVR